MNILAAILFSTLALSNIEQGDGLRILGFFPFPVKSHHRVFQPLLRGLADKGHHITYFAPYTMDQAHPTIKHILVKDYLPDLFAEVKTIPWPLNNWLPTVMGVFGVALGERVLQDPAFQQLIASDAQFDVILSEMTVVHETFSPLSHRFNAYTVDVLPSGNLHWAWYLYGNPYDTSYIIETSVMYSDRMNLWERIHNTFNSLSQRFIRYHCYMPKYRMIADKYFRYPGWETRPPLDELIRNASLLLVNSHYSLNYPFPLASNVKDIGGINLQPESKPIPQDLKAFMDGATDGVIYFTLGSHAQVSSTLGEKLRNAFTKAFGGLKQRVLWKWETEFPDLPDNIRISKWFPQQEILAHKNIKLFITHGGFLSLTESVYNGVPTIAIPLMGDQYKNAKHMETMGYGMPLLFENITEETISWSINHVLNNPRFAENARKRSLIFRDQPYSPLETAIYWIEYVVRHKGAGHLRPAVASMPWYQQAMLDVYATLAALIIIPLYITFKIIKCICKCICGRSSSKDSHKKKKRN